KSEARMSNWSALCGRRFRHSDLVIPSDFVICHSGLRITVHGYSGRRVLNRTVSITSLVFQLDFAGPIGRRRVSAEFGDLAEVKRSRAIARAQLQRATESGFSGVKILPLELAERLFEGFAPGFRLRDLVTQSDADDLVHPDHFLKSLE